MIDLHLDAFPSRWNTQPQWSVYRLEKQFKAGQLVIDPETGQSKLSKIPYMAHQAGRAKSTDATTWTDLDAAHAYLLRTQSQSQPMAGLLYAIRENDNVTFFDFDRVFSPDGEIVKQDQWEAAKSLGGYCEISQSGRGLHVLVGGRKPDGWQAIPGIEVYDRARFIAVTGNLTPWSARDIEDDQEAIDGFFERYGAPLRSTSTASRETTERLSDAEAAAIVAAIAPHWADGQRHNISVAVAGWLAKAGVTEEQAAEITTTLSANDADQRDRLKAVSDTYSKLRSGRETAGWTAVRGMMPDDAVRLVDGILERFRGASAPRLIHPGNGRSDDQGPLVTMDNWSIPGSLESVDLPGFPTGVFPPIVEDFVSALSHATETPRALAATVCLGSIATAARGWYRICVKSGYFEQTNLWLAPFLSSGNRKSSVFAEAIDPLLEWEYAKAKQDRIERAHWQAQRDIDEMTLKDLKSNASRGKDRTAAREQELQAMALQERLDTGKKPKITKLIADDITPEKAVTVLDEQEGVLAVMSAEGASFLANAGGRYANSIPNFDNLLKGHSGDTIIVDRGSREGELIRRPCLNMVVSPQPSVARTWGEMETFVDRGGAARILACFPKSSVGFRRLDTQPVPESVRRDWGSLLTGILNLTPPQGGDKDGHRIPCTLKLSAEAYEVWDGFWHEVEAMLRPGGELEGLEGWGNKAPGAAARIAGLLHIALAVNTNVAPAEGITTNATPEQFEIEREVMESAVTIMRFFVEHAKAFYNHLSGFGDQSAERDLWQVIQTMSSPATKRELFRRARSNRFRRAADIEAPLSRLEELDYIRITRQQHEGGRGGRPSDVILVNPLILGQNRQNLADKPHGQSEPLRNTGQNRQNPDGGAGERAAEAAA